MDESLKLSQHLATMDDADVLVVPHGPQPSCCQKGDESTIEVSSRRRILDDSIEWVDVQGPLAPDLGQVLASPVPRLLDHGHRADVLLGMLQVEIRVVIEPNVVAK